MPPTPAVTALGAVTQAWVVSAPLPRTAATRSVRGVPSASRTGTSWPTRGEPGQVRLSTMESGPRSATEPATTGSRSTAARAAGSASAARKATRPMPSWSAITEVGVIARACTPGTARTRSTTARFSPGVPAGVTTRSAADSWVRTSVTSERSIVRMLPIRQPAKAMISTTGVAVAAVRRKAVSELSRAVAQTMPPASSAGRPRSRAGRTGSAVSSRITGPASTPASRTQPATMVSSSPSESATLAAASGQLRAVIAMAATAPPSTSRPPAQRNACAPREWRSTSASASASPGLIRPAFTADSITPPIAVSRPIRAATSSPHQETGTVKSAGTRSRPTSHRPAGTAPAAPSAHPAAEASTPTTSASRVTSART